MAKQQQRSQLRQSLRKKRIQLPTLQQQELANRIAKHVSELEIYKSAEKVALYLAVNGEADPSGILFKTKKRYYLPILSRLENQGLDFVEISADTKYIPNKFSIPEPEHKASEIISGEALDLVLMPLVGYDLKGNRLGMGGGYYDRCFKFKNNTTPDKLTSPVLMGIAYAFQQVESLTAESWDVRLDYIATENGVIYTGK